MNTDLITIAEMAEKMCLENLLPQIEVFQNLALNRNDKNKALFEFMNAKFLGITFAEWHKLLYEKTEADFRMIHNGQEELKLFQDVFEYWNKLFQAVVTDIFDKWTSKICTITGKTIMPYFADSNNPKHFAVNNRTMFFDGVYIKYAYREYSPETKDCEFISMRVSFEIV